jgi:outer membrane receptor protein involved in Fe transport
MNLGFMMRETAATLGSSASSIPIRADQNRSVTEAYVNGSITLHRDSHELRFGGETTRASIHERFESLITARRLGSIRFFDSDLPTAFEFDDGRNLREGALFVQDVVRIGPATVSAGLRYDRYRLMADESAVSPRVSGSWLVDRKSLVLHASYDRVFEPPPVENIILASSDLSEDLGDEAEWRPLVSSRGHFFEFGGALAVGGRARLEITWFRRQADDMTDDELLLNTAVSFPIAFSEATITGWETAIDVPRWGALSGSLSYSYMHGVGTLPFTGGLFLGDQADEVLAGDEEFALSQDQTHTLRGRLRRDVGARAWVAGMVRFDSGLPVETEEDVDEQVLAQQYGERVVERVKFDTGRVKASLNIDVSAGVRLFGEGGRGLRLQGDVFNAFDRLNVINFAGLLSGTALAPRRSFALRLQMEF